MSEDMKNYLKIANFYIQKANNMGELKCCVASIIYDNDKKQNYIYKQNSIIKEVREILEKYISNPSGTKGGWHIDCWNNEDINRLDELLEILKGE